MLAGCVNVGPCMNMDAGELCIASDSRGAAGGQNT